LAEHLAVKDRLVKGSWALAEGEEPQTGS